MTSQGRRGRKQRRGQGRKVAPVSEMASAYKSIKSSEKEEWESSRVERERRSWTLALGVVFWLNEMETDAAAAAAAQADAAAAAHLSKWNAKQRAQITF